MTDLPASALISRSTDGDYFNRPDHSTCLDSANIVEQFDSMYTFAIVNLNECYYLASKEARGILRAILDSLEPENIKIVFNNVNSLSAEQHTALFTFGISTTSTVHSIIEYLDSLLCDLDIFKGIVWDKQPNINITPSVRKHVIEVFSKYVTRRRWLGEYVTELTAPELPDSMLTYVKTYVLSFQKTPKGPKQYVCTEKYSCDKDGNFVPAPKILNI